MKMMTTLHHLRRVAVALALAIMSVGAHAQHLWPKLQYGMTPADALRTVPGSVPAADGAAELEGFRIADRKFRVRFEFRSNRLVQVHLRETVFMEPNERTRLNFDKVVNALRQVQGAETYRHVESEPSGLSGEAGWRKGDAETVVTISPSTQNHSTILINFFYRGK